MGSGIQAQIGELPRVMPMEGKDELLWGGGGKKSPKWTTPFGMKNLSRPKKRGLLEKKKTGMRVN